MDKSKADYQSLNGVKNRDIELSLSSSNEDSKTLQ